jgi:hypothetical protein
MIIYIYALLDPDTNDVRYIGKTNDMSRRLYTHCRLDPKDNLKKVEWVASLKSNGKKPKMIVIEECTSDNWIEREKFWIAHYRSLSDSLLNISGGGHGQETKFPHQIIARVTSEARAEINRIITKTGTSESEVVRDAVEKFIELFEADEASQK